MCSLVCLFHFILKLFYTAFHLSLTEEYCTGGISQLFAQALDRAKELETERRVLERVSRQAMPQTAPMDQDSHAKHTNYKPRLTANTNTTNSKYKPRLTASTSRD